MPNGSTVEQIDITPWNTRPFGFAGLALEWLAFKAQVYLGPPILAALVCLAVDFLSLVLAGVLQQAGFNVDFAWVGIGSSVYPLLQSFWIIGLSAATYFGSAHREAKFKWLEFEETVPNKQLLLGHRELRMQDMLEYLKGRSRSSEDARIAATGRRGRSLGLLFYAIGVGCLLVALFIFLALAAHFVGRQDASKRLADIGTVLFVPALMSFALFSHLARRSRQPRAAALLTADPRAPMLFLRRFSDDGVATWPSGKVSQFRSSYPVRLEEVCATVASEFGPFVAIGEPGERLPQLGAARDYCSENEWQDVVSTWLDRALMVIAIAGSSDWLCWELRSLVEKKHLDRLMLLLPPKGFSLKMGSFPRPKKQAQKPSSVGSQEFLALDRATRWKSVKGCFAGTRWEQELEGVDVRKAIAILFRDDGLLVINSRRNLEYDYTIAVLLALFEILRLARADVRDG